MNPTNDNQQAAVVLRLPKPVHALLSQAQNAHDRVNGNPVFPNPSPSMADLQAAIDALTSAQAAALTKVTGAVITRNAKRAVLVRLLKQLAAYVQATADAHPGAEAATITSAGFSVRKVPSRTKRVFTAKPGGISGTVKLTAVSASRRASYEWAYSTDGGKTWLAAPVTLQAHTTIAGLVPGTNVLFRSRPVTKAGEGEWSQPVSVIVG